MFKQKLLSLPKHKFSGFIAVLFAASAISLTFVACDNNSGGNSTVPVERVTLSADTLSVDIGYTKTLTATVEPANATDKNVTWSSDNTSVATVDANGTVTGVSAGVTTVTAASAADSTKFASCAVTVKAITYITGTGGYNITQGGFYQIQDKDVKGLITVSTEQPVTIIGVGGVDDSSGSVSTGNSDLSIRCTVAGADLTVEDLNIQKYYSNTPNRYPAIDFTGIGNKLHLKGISYIQVPVSNFNTAAACVHVGSGTQLTIDGDGSLYMYGSSGGSCIGGANAESNGDIIIDGGHIFGYASRAASTMGSGQQVSATGSITINGGEVHLFNKARGACIGSGGMSSNTVGNGAQVRVTGGNLNLYVDYTGSAIGNGGGQKAANNLQMDPNPDPGTLTVTGGSVKTTMMANALQFWSLSGGSPNLINDTGITAVKTDGTEQVYLLILDLTGIPANAVGNEYTVKESGATLYSGDMPYNFSGVATDDWNTKGIWPYSSLTKETNLYLYVAGKNHTFDCNGSSVTYNWDGSSFVKQ